jgi:outer membrane protein TolC
VIADLPQAQQAFEATQSAYETGKGGFAEWITAQRMLRDVQATELSHQTDYQIAIAELEGIVGAEIRTTPSRSLITK